jgi:hypothetical protein
MKAGRPDEQTDRWKEGMDGRCEEGMKEVKDKRIHSSE